MERIKGRFSEPQCHNAPIEAASKDAHPTWPDTKSYGLLSPIQSLQRSAL